MVSLSVFSCQSGAQESQTSRQLLLTRFCRLGCFFFRDDFGHRAVIGEGPRFPWSHVAGRGGLFDHTPTAVRGEADNGLAMPSTGATRRAGCVGVARRTSHLDLADTYTGRTTHRGMSGELHRHNLRNVWLLCSASQGDYRLPGARRLACRRKGDRCPRRCDRGEPWTFLDHRAMAQVIAEEEAALAYNSRQQQLAGVLAFLSLDLTPF